MHACVQEPELDPVTGRISVRLGQNVAEMISILVGTRSVDQVRSHAQVPRHSDNLHCTIMHIIGLCAIINVSSFVDAVATLGCVRSCDRVRHIDGLLLQKYFIRKQRELLRQGQVRKISHLLCPIQLSLTTFLNTGSGWASGCHRGETPGAITL